MTRQPGTDGGGPAVPVGGGVPVDPQTGERFGYLPRKAAQRKIIIRRTLGLPWVLAALAAALLIAVAGIGFLLSDPGRPPRRYADQGALTAYPAGQVTALPSGAGWVDRRATVSVWLTRADFCPGDGGWAAGATRWDAAGRTRDGRDNLLAAATRVAQGRLYVAAQQTRRVAGAAPADLGPCRGSRPVSP
jgi:hypothetical protein